MVVIVCGLPGPGKTTLATRLQRRLAGYGYAFDLLHSDDYERRTYEQMYEHVADATEEHTGSRRDWILEGTFFRREWRNRFYRLAEIYEVWVKASLETCLERNRERAESIPETGLTAIYGRFEPPRADVEIDTEELGVEAALDRLFEVVLDWLDD